jgi:hypothetical protein
VSAPEMSPQHKYVLASDKSSRDEGHGGGAAARLLDLGVASAAER